MSDDRVIGPPATQAAAAAAPMTQDATRSRTEAGYTHFRLTPDLEDRFETIREIPGGGQAGLLLCQVRGSEPEELVVVKMFHATVRGGHRDPRETIRALDEAHVVRYVEPYFGVTNDRWWEVLEYCPLGTLKDYAGSHGGRLGGNELLSVIRELTDALDHIHSQPVPVIHRDIKPANVLVHSDRPLDLVLTDFGLAVLMEYAGERRSGTRTPGYAAPEASGDVEVAPPLDWWALGMTIAELAAGHHPFESKEGFWLGDAQIISEVSSRPVPLTDIDDPRLVELLRGLLTRDPSTRWRAPQVREWLAGGMPAVDAVVPAPVSRTTIEPFPFGSRLYSDPTDLAAAFAADWGRLAGMLGGIDLAELVSWVDDNFPERSIRKAVDARRGNNENLDRLAARVICRLDPDGPPRFMGLELDSDSLLALPRAVALDVAVGDKVEKLFHSRALLTYSTLTGYDELALIEADWQEQCRAANLWFDHVKTAGSMTTQLRTMILGISVERVRSGEVMGVRG
jgi:serine/threonine protein kinase